MEARASGEKSHGRDDETWAGPRRMSWICLQREEEPVALGNTAQLKVQNEYVMLEEQCQCWAGSPGRSPGKWGWEGRKIKLREVWVRPGFALDFMGKEAVGKTS